MMLVALTTACRRLPRKTAYLTAKVVGTAAPWGKSVRALTKTVAKKSANSAPAPGADKPLAVLVIGMHRSGTSALSGVLTMLGVPAPAVLHAADRHNERGYFEPQAIIDFHERVFEQLGSPSNDPLPVTYDWVRSPLGQAAVDELASLLDDEFAGRAMCLFKDPRMCRLAPLWTEAVPRSGRNGVAILPFRRASEVAGSLRAKAGVPLAAGLFMWLQHVILGERFTRDMPRTFPGYDALLGDWRGAVQRMAKDLDLVWPRDLMRAGPEIDAFLSGELRHQRARTETQPHSPLDVLCERVWAALQRLQADPRDAVAMTEMDAVWAEMEAGNGVFGPLVVSYQHTLDETRQAYAHMEGRALRAEPQVESLTRRRQQDRALLEDTRKRLAEALQELNNHSAALMDAWARLEKTDAELNGIKSTLTWQWLWPVRARLVRVPLLRGLTYRIHGLVWRVIGPSVERKRARLLAAAAEPAAEAAPRKRSTTKIFFLSGEADTPGHLYRIERYAEAARVLDCEVVIASAAEARSKLGELADTDIVFIWRAPWSETIEAVVETAREAGAEIVFDCDDLMIDPEVADAKVIDGIRSQYLPEDVIRDHFERMQATMAAATYCTAPTQTLAQQMRRFLKTAFVLPNGFDAKGLERSRSAARARRAEPSDGLVRIGYASGSRTHQKDFAQAADAVAAVMRARPQVRLVLFERDGDPVMDLGEFPVFVGLEDRVEWREIVPLEQLPDELARFDINLAPLEVGNVFCEAKSELKYFEAALVDVPTVASPTQPFADAIRDGETGFLAATPAEWEQALLQLVDDEGLRRRMARAAFYDVAPKYGPERRVELMLSLIEQVQFRGPRAARAFELDIARGARPAAPVATVPEHEIIFEQARNETAAVTVIIPLYNYARFIEEALESVKAQTLSALDLVVVDDRSTDNSLEVAQGWIEANADRFNRVRLIRNVKNSGLGLTRNVGFANADTPFVLPLDADNRLLPEAAEALLNRIENRNAAFVYPLIALFGDEVGQLGTDRFNPARFVYSNYIDAMALVRRTAWMQVGGYDHVRFGWEDYDLWCRFVAAGLYGEQLEEVLAEYRVHGGSMLRQQTERLENNLALVADMERRHPWLNVIRPDPSAAKDQ